MTKISITRALVELKRLDARIKNEISSGVYVAQQAGSGQNAKIFGVGITNTASDAISKINASFQAVEKLIENRTKIKAAIVKSNAVTFVTIGGESITVAEAIDRKATVEYHKMYAEQMQRQLAKARSEVEVANVKLDSEILSSVQALLGGDKKTQDKATLDMISGAQKAQKERALIGESQVQSRIDAQRAIVLDIETELDFVLSESNAITQIEVNL